MTDLPDHDHWLTPSEAERLQGFPYAKRREEARLGRWTAKRAVARALRLEEDTAILRDLVIRNASDGAPEVFFDGRRAPMSISMTDRADWAVCTVIGGDRPIGCDLELVEPRSSAFVADYFTSEERADIEAAPHDHDLLANLIWSAKESALKVLRTGLRRDTRSVDVKIMSEELDGGWRSLYVTTEEDSVFTGWWCRFGEFVFTYVSATGTVAPTSLIDPPPLEKATPSHSWMAEPRRSPPAGPLGPGR